MQIKHNYTGIRLVIPPGCRRPRRQTFEGFIMVEVQEVTGSDAPIALLEHTEYFVDDDYQPITYQYRWWNGNLWIDFQEDKPTQKLEALELEYTEHYQKFTSTHAQSPEEVAQEYFQKRADNHLLIDGVLYKQIAEPLYQIEVGHSYTIVTVSKCCSLYHGNRWSTYSIDQWEEVEADVHYELENRQDYQVSVSSKFEILIPDAVQADPQAEALEGDRTQLAKNFELFVDHSKWLFGHSRSPALHRKEMTRFLLQQLIRLTEKG